MVARPPLKVSVEPMTLDDVAAVHNIERASFPVPWPDYAFRQELQTNRLAHYLVVRIGGSIVAYGGLWMMVDEAHITTFAVLPEWRRRGIGGRLMLGLMDVALSLNARIMTLEVRLSNRAARVLYGQFGFKPVGVRPRYYSDNGEDALIMTTDQLSSRAMTDRLEQLEQRYGDPVISEDESASPNQEEL